MIRTTRTVLIPGVALTLALSACGGTGSTATGGVVTPTPGACPTSSTRVFAKTRFVADIGLAAGTFHHWIYAPYRAGSFDKRAKGRLTALVKAGAVALVDAKLIDNAYRDVEASPALCTLLIAPLGDLRAALATAKEQLITGNTTGLGSLEGLVQRIESTAKSHGASIIENSDLASAQSALGNG